MSDVKKQALLILNDTDLVGAFEWLEFPDAVSGLVNGQHYSTKWISPLMISQHTSLYLSFVLSEPLLVFKAWQHPSSTLTEDSRF